MKGNSTVSVARKSTATRNVSLLHGAFHIAVLGSVRPTICGEVGAKDTEQFGYRVGSRRVVAIFFNRLRYSKHAWCMKHTISFTFYAKLGNVLIGHCWYSYVALRCVPPSCRTPATCGLQHLQSNSQRNGLDTLLVEVRSVFFNQRVTLAKMRPKSADLLTNVPDL